MATKTEVQIKQLKKEIRELKKCRNEAYNIIAWVALGDANQIKKSNEWIKKYEKFCKLK